MNNIRHECGVFGIFGASSRNLAEDMYYGLFALQHRGQESAGIAVCCNGNIQCYKNLGLVSEVFDRDRLKAYCEGKIALGHVRYATSSTRNIVCAQPLVFKGIKDKFAICNNGRLVNSKYLINQLIDEGMVFQSGTDSEIIAALINKYTEKDIIEGVKRAVRYLKGGFAFIVCTTDRLIAVRDRSALIPLSLGSLKDGYVVSSESAAIDAIGGAVIRDIKAGEMVIIDDNGIQSYFMDNIKKRSCIFELVYLARPDSAIDGKSVYEARFDTGRRLAIRYPIEADLVAGAPDSGVLSGRGYSYESGLPYLDALSKNRYIGRSFIQPEQVVREKSVKIKLNAIKSNIQGKRVILSDDSIVRGTTCKKTVDMLKGAGAKEVHLVVASPPIKYPCYYGVDMTTTSQLIAANHSVEDICKIVGADSINYISIEDLLDCCGGNEFCTACITGDYPVKWEE
ncbi:MAG: amidophosphoribosyltransferase [Christensenellales bacterium]